MVVTPDAYMSCLTKLGDDVADRDLYRCVIQTEHETTNTYIRWISLVFAGVLIFSMQVKFVYYCIGSITKIH